MKVTRQLQSNCQTACLARLFDWHKRKSYGLFRKTDDFVQWIIFEDSRFNPLIVPHYSVQALAEQFPTEALTLGRRVQSKRGGDLWISAEELNTNQADIIDAIIVQTVPSPLQQLDAQAVAKFINEFGTSHVSALTTYGIACVVLGNIDDARKFLREAAERYKKMSTSWASQNERTLQEWLSTSDEQLMHVLRQEARKGADLLRL